MEMDSNEKLPSLVWKEPINGKTAFFTEEVYHQLAGPEPTIAERATKMMDALGFPPPSKWKRRRKTDDWDNPQSNIDSGPSSMSFSQNEKTIDSNTGAPLKQDPAPCSQQEARPETEEKDIESKEDSLLGTAAASDIMDSPLSPPPQEEDQDSKFLQPKPDVSEAECIIPLAGDSDAVSKQSFASTSTAGIDSTSQVPDSDSISGPSGSQLHGGKGFHLMDKSGHQPWKTNRTKKDNNPGDTAGQTRFPGQRAKMHDKGRRPPPEPRKSLLNHDQHIRYLHLFKKCTQRFYSGFLNPPTQHELKELKEFEALQMQVGKEQEECQAFLKQVTLHNPYLYTYLPQHVNQYTQDKEQSGWKRAETYCRYYNIDSRLPLSANIPQLAPDGVPIIPTMNLVQTLLEMGSKCKLVMPDLNPHPSARPRRTVSTDLQKITTRFPAVYPSSQRSWNHEPASKDSNLEGLVQKYHCHIATSASVLQQLIDNSAPDYAVAWDIPVVVKEYGNGAASQKVVYLDKPLLPKSRSLCQKKSQYLQKALRTFVCQPHNERKSTAGKGRNLKEQAQEEPAKSMDTEATHGRGVGTVHEDEDDDPFGSFSMDDLETFGSDKMFSKTKKKVPDLKCDSMKLGGNGTGTQAPASSVTAGSVTQVSDHSETGAQCHKHVSENTLTSDNKSDNIDSKPIEDVKFKQESEDKDSPEAKQLSEDKDTGSATEAAPNQSKHCSSSELLDHSALSDTDDEGALVIDVSSSPNKASVSTSRPSHGLQHSMVRRSQSSRDSIFDEMPAQPTPVLASCTGQSQPDEPPPRRITRSTSRQFSSDNENRVSCSSMDDGSSLSQTSSVTTCNTIVAVQESKDAASPITSPRTTRQSAKRKISDPKPNEETETGFAATEELSPTKKCKKIIDQEDVSTEKSPAAVNTLVNSTSDEVEERAGKGKNAAPSQAGFVSKKQTGKSEKQSSAAPPTYLESILKEMNPSGESVMVKVQEDPSQYRQPGCPGEHVGYHLWDLSGISMIVRCNSHCFVRDMRQEQKAVYVRAKPERQFPHGLEQNTLNECVRSWLGCYLRPNSYMLRVRVNMQNHEVIHTEELHLNQILQPTLNFSPQYAFALLRNIFCRLIDLPAGSYLLSHESGADHIQLKAGTGAKRGSYDFRTHYVGLIMQEVDKSVPWIPVDPTLMLSHHWRQGLIPATFQPPDFDPKKKKQQFVVPKKKFRNKKKKQN